MKQAVKRAIHDLLCALGLRVDPGVWILPDQLFVCAYPRTDDALAALATANVRLIVNLHMRAHATHALARHHLVEVHLPTRDFHAPTPDALRRGVNAIEDAIGAGQRVAVHCGSGRGRTGTLLACVFVARGMPPDAAIARVREARPGAIETRAQALAVSEFRP